MSTLCGFFTGFRNEYNAMYVLQAEARVQQRLAGTLPDGRILRAGDSVCRDLGGD